MEEIKAEFIERYQILYAKDPQSKVFAPLAEAYRKMGLLSQALDVCKHGVSNHPDFVSGRVALAKILLDLQRAAEALPHLEAATRLSPDNILAHRLLGKIFLQLRRPKEALQAFKMVLFLNPQDAEAKEYVSRWESLTADEYEDQLLPPAGQTHFTANRQPEEVEKKTLALVDAYLVRKEYASAASLLQMLPDAEHPEVAKRLRLVTIKTQKQASSSPNKEMTMDPELRQLRIKKALLESLLQSII